MGFWTVFWHLKGVHRFRSWGFRDLQKLHPPILGKAYKVWSVNLDILFIKYKSPILTTV